MSKGIKVTFIDGTSETIKDGTHWNWLNLLGFVKVTKRQDNTERTTKRFSRKIIETKVPQNTDIKWFRTDVVESIEDLNV